MHKLTYWIIEWNEAHPDRIQCWKLLHGGTFYINGVIFWPTLSARHFPLCWAGQQQISKHSPIAPSEGCLILFPF